MKTYNKSKIMKNAWYLKKVQPTMTFSACLKKAWRNEKISVMTAIIENRPMEEPTRPALDPLPLIIPADYYGDSRT